MEKNEEYKKGFADGRKKEREEIKKEIGKYADDLDKIVDNTLDSNKDHDKGIRNGWKEILNKKGVEWWMKEKFVVINVEIL